MSKLGSARKNIMRQDIKRNKMLIDDYKFFGQTAALYKNGITQEYVHNKAEEAAKEAYELGRKEGEQFLIKAIYCGIVLAMHERGAADDEIIEVVKLVDSKVMYAINETDLIDEVLTSTGIEMRFDDPLERVHELEG